MYNMLDYIRSIVDKQPIELDKGYSQYALNIYFSKFKNCIPYLDNISRISLTDSQHYKYLMLVIPRGWQKKIEFNKKSDKKQKEIENLIKYFNINEKEAEEYFYLIDENEMKEIMEYYDV